MAIYSPKYPIEYDFGAPGNFVISVDTFDNVIFKGYTFSGKVDISGICQSYMNASLVDVPNETIDEGYFLDIETDSVVKRFFVGRSEGSPAYYFDVANDYNDDWIQVYDSDYITSYSVTGKYHPDDLVFVDVNSPNGTATIESNVIPGGITGFSSAHVTVKNGKGEEGGIVIEEILTDRVSPIGLTRISFDGQTYMGMRSPSTGSSRIVFKSDDLATWVPIPAPYSYQANSINYLNGNFLIGANWVIYKSNETTVDVLRFSEEENFYESTYSNGYYCIVSKGSNGSVYVNYSRDLTSWTSGGFNRSDDVRCIAADGNGRLMLAGYNGVIFDCSQTPHTLSTTRFTSVGSSDFRPIKMIYANGKFIVVGSNNSITEAHVYVYENEVWSGYNIGNTQCNSVAYGNGVYCFVLIDDGVVLTNDFVNFETINIDTPTFTDVLFDGEKFVVVGHNRYIYTIEIRQGSIENITVNGIEYPIEYTAGCEEYTIYWVNKQGGRSQLLVEGNTSEKTSNTNYEIRTNYNRLNPASFEYRRIYNDVSREYAFDLGWLTDEQYLQVNDLMNSPRIWIHDHKTDRIISARLVGSTDNINNFVSNRNASKTIVLKEAQNHIRR